MKICVFDTETTSLEKPFCYNIGFVIYDTEANEILYKQEYIAEQVWHNMELFSTAYYAEKRPLYISRMKAKKIKMDKFGYITQKMARLFKEFDVEIAFAYNSSFDEKVFNFNCDWFKVRNPFDDIPIRDIRGFVHNFIAFTKDFQSFCDSAGSYTESGNYSTTAETLFQYISGNTDFEEEHTALSDSVIELAILLHCLSLGGDITKEYKTYRSVPRKIQKNLEIKQGENKYLFQYEKITINKDKTKIILK